MGLLLLVGGGCTLRLPARKRPPEPLPPAIAEKISPAKSFDHRPYEFIWAKRVEEVEPFVDFEGLLGWTVEVAGGVQAEFSRTDERQLWGAYVGELSYAGTNRHGRIVVRPPAPLEIRDRYDSVDLWVFGNRDWAQTAAGGTPVEIILLMEAADGEPFSWALDLVDWYGWWLLHRRVDPREEGARPYPHRLRGVAFENACSPGGTTLYLDSLSFYKERLPPLEFEARPERNVPLFPGQSPGLHTGPGKLPFPTRPETILPPQAEPSFTNDVLEVGQGAYRFRYAGADGELVYRFEPSRGFAGIDVTWNGDFLCRALSGAGIVEESSAAGEVVVLRREGGAVRVEYTSGASYTLRMAQKSLIIEAVHRTGQATGFSLGAFARARNPRSLSIPMLSMGVEAQPRVAIMDVHGEGTNVSLFAGTFLDWYVSNASELFASNAVGPETVTVNGGARYGATTEGRRNGLFERVLLTVSPRLDEVLPTVANPVGLNAAQAVARLWVDAGEVEDYEQEHRACSALRLHGASELIQCSGLSAWRDDYESYTLRTHADPYKGGDESLAAFVKSQRSLGWQLGLYANYFGISPLSRYWSKDAVQRLGDGSWKRGGPGYYVMKAPAAVQRQAQIAPQVRERFGVNASFVDMLTCVPPWAATEYDARVPGAATFGQAYYCYGELLRNQSTVFGGPVVGPEGFQWMYAGLTDAHLGSAQDEAVRAGHPYLPLFALTRIHPLECGFGLGTLKEFFELDPHWKADAGAAVDQYLAAQLAYGRCGRLADPRLGMALVCRTYYMMQQVQARYGLKTPGRIAYWDGAHLVDTSEALLRGASARSQMYLHYPGDLELWVNGSSNETWEVKAEGRVWRLPPYGWVAAAPGFLEVSAEIGGRRIDYVRSAPYVYFDGRGSWAPFRGLACASALAARWVTEEGRPALEVVDIARAGRFGWRDPEGKRRPEGCRAYDEKGARVGDAEITAGEDVDWFRGPTNALRYVIGFAG